jgi:hypothetical protein
LNSVGKILKMTMEKNRENRHLKYFVGHKPPVFDLWLGYQYFDSSNCGDLAIEDFDGLRGNSDKVLSEYYSLFKLRRKLLNEKIYDGQITICQHRRFVLNNKVGVGAINQPFAQVVSLAEMRAVKADMLLPKNNKFLVGTPYVYGGSLIDQYQAHHHVRDLLRFTSDILDSGLLTEIEVNEFLNSKYFIPAPACGVFEMSLFLNLLDILEKCAKAFHAMGYKKRIGYQGRVTSFLLERLNSFMLVKLLMRRGVDFRGCIGYTTVINEGLFIKGG